MLCEAVRERSCCPVESYFDLKTPLFEQPLRDIDAVLIVLAPEPKLIRADACFSCQPKSSYLPFKLGSARLWKCAWENGLAPVRIAPSAMHSDSQHDTPTGIWRDARRRSTARAILGLLSCAYHGQNQGIRNPEAFSCSEFVERVKPTRAPFRPELRLIVSSG